MKLHFQVVVIGGGIAGCSTLYHLTQEGITDCVLIERDELTSGTTWHSAAQVTNFGTNQTMIGLKSHSIKLYRELACDSEYPVGYNYADGGLRLASQDWHLDGYKHFISMAKGMGVEFELIDSQECKRRHPLLSTDGLKGALWDSHDGHIDPSQLCQALAGRARSNGAQIYRQTPVTNLTKKKDGWIVHTAHQDIECQTIVNAAGYRCNEIGAMMNVIHPVVSMEHQYFVTQEIDEIKHLGFRLPLIRCPTDDFYQRQEKHGLLIGFYEQGCKTWGIDGIDSGFSMSLCPDDLDRVSDVMQGAINRLPCLETSGIHTIVNGPITYTPDGLPLVGKVPNVCDAYCIIGLRAGLGEGGGHGWLLAQLIAHGEAQYDTWCLDPRRFTKYADIEYTASKAIEDYRNEFRFHRPHEHRSAGRPAKVTELTNYFESIGAHFVVVNGWERVAYIKPSDEFVEEHTFRFANWHDVVGAEVQNVKENVGIMEVSGFNQYEITGEGAHDWLDTIMCSKVSKELGRVGLHYYLNHHGGVKGEVTLANVSSECIRYGSAAASEYHDWDWLHEHNPPRNVRIESLTNTHTVLVLAGPNSRSVLSDAMPDTPCDAQSFPWMRVRQGKIGEVSVVAMSVSFSGELAFELHIPNEHLSSVYHRLMEVGKAYNIGHFGLYATESMRIEKGYRHWKSDLITEFDPFESSLDRFVRMDKGDFIGKFALREKQDMRKKFVSMIVECDEAPAQSGGSILLNGEVVGTVTSAAWGYRVNKNITMGFVESRYSKIGMQLKIEIIGKARRAKVCEPCLYDVKNERMQI